MDEHELQIAFGPVGAAGFVLLAFGLVRRSRAPAAAGAVAVMADLTLPALRGVAKQLTK
jgi:hypothetical protein